MADAQTAADAYAVEQAMVDALYKAIAASPVCAASLRRGAKDEAQVIFTGDDHLASTPKGAHYATHLRTCARRLIREGYQAAEVVAITEELINAELAAKKAAE